MSVKKTEQDDTIEERISMEIIVDAYNEEEQAMGWYNYLQDKLSFPFQGECHKKRSISPLKPNQEVKVIGMADEDECLQEMFVEIEYGDASLCVPLSQITVTSGNEDTQQAVKDWHYWVAQGYQF